MIEFTTTPDDWALAGEYQLRISSTMRDTVRRAQWTTVGAVGLILVVAGWFLRATPGIGFGLLGGLAVSIFAVVRIPEQTRKRMGAHMRRLYAEAAASGISTDCQLAAMDDGLSCKGGTGTAVLNWTALSAIEETPSHVVLISKPATAIVIPRERVKAGDLPEFVEQCRKRMSGHVRTVEIGARLQPLD